MEVAENMSLDPLATDFVKQELEWDGAGSCSSSALLQSDLEFTEHTPIQEEYLKEERNGQEVALACLYSDHEVKDEMVLGPEILQPADIAFTLQAAPAPKFIERPVLRNGVVRLERVIDHEAAPPARSGAGCGVDQSQQRSGSEVQTHECCSADTRPDERSRGGDVDPTVAGSTSHGIHPTGRLNNPYIYQSTNKSNERIDIELKTYYCRICRKNFTHTGDKPYCCIDCEQKFKRSYQLKRQEHQKEVSVKTAKRYFCDNCEHKLKVSYQLKCQEHENSDVFVKIAKPYCCDNCEQKSKLSYQLKRQENQKDAVTVETEKPYCCEKCGSRFKDLSALMDHKRIHTPRKPYSCGKCKNKFVVLCSFNGKTQKFGRFICPNASLSRIFKNPVTKS